MTGLKDQDEDEDGDEDENMLNRMCRHEQDSYLYMYIYPLQRWHVCWPKMKSFTINLNSWWELRKVMMNSTIDR